MCGEFCCVWRLVSCAGIWIARHARAHRHVECEQHLCSHARSQPLLLRLQVNGLRSWVYPFEVQKGKPPVNNLRELLDFLDADIICFQETKLRPGSLTAFEALVEGYHAFFSICPNARGYSGVVTYTRKATATPVRCEEGFSGLLPMPSAPAKKDGKESKETKESSSGGSGSSAEKDKRPSSERIGGCDDLHATYEQADLRELDKEGRCVVTDHGDFVLFNVYFPNAGDTGGCRPLC